MSIVAHEIGHMTHFAGMGAKKFLMRKAGNNHYAVQPFGNLEMDDNDRGIGAVFGMMFAFASTSLPLAEKLLIQPKGIVGTALDMMIEAGATEALCASEQDIEAYRAGDEKLMNDVAAYALSMGVCLARTSGFDDWAAQAQRLADGEMGLTLTDDELAGLLNGEPPVLPATLNGVPFPIDQLIG